MALHLIRILSLIVVASVGIRTAKSATPHGARLERASNDAVSRDLVFMLHGISKTHYDMMPMGKALHKAGFDTVNWKYPSRQHSVTDLADMLAAVVEAYPAERIHFVTHSMGGIIVRAYLAKYKPENVSRFVMVAPPNQGAAMATFFRDNTIFKAWFGPAGKDLCSSDGLCDTLGTPDCEFGIIAGGTGTQHGFMPLLKADNDGTVKVDETRLEGSRDFLVVPYHHGMIHYMPRTIRNTVTFLQEGHFRETSRGRQPRAYRVAALTSP